MSRFRVPLGTIVQRPKVFRDIVFTCVVLHNMLRTHHRGADGASSIANDVVVLQNDDNYRNPSRETNRNTTSVMWVHWLGRMTGSEMGATLETEAGICQSCIGQSNYSKKFYLGWCCFYQISRKKSNTFSTYFKTIFNHMTSL